MRVQSIETRYYRLPLHDVGDAGHGVLDTEELIVVDVAADGLRGTGYAYTIGRGGRAIQAAIEYDLKPLLIGKEVGDLSSTWAAMWSALLYVGRGGIASFAIAALDIAFWDLHALERQLPLYRLLGLERPRSIQAYGSGVDLPLSLEALLAQVEGFMGRGYRAVKVKVGRPDRQEDEARIGAVRRLIGDDRALMVDANMGWTAEEAIERGRCLEQHNLGWIEEPTIPEDVDGHRAIADELATPVALGESLHSPWEFERYIEAGAVEIVQLDPVTLGGITPWLRVARAAAQHDLPLSSHYCDELSAHLLAASHRPLYLEKHAFALDPYLVEPQQVIDGAVWPSEVPGHGIQFSSSALEPYRA